VLHSEKRFEQWLPALFDGQFHWDFLAPVFHGTKIRPMDIDCCIERKGSVLLFETKTPGKDIETGQRITLQTLWGKGATIIHLEGKTPETIAGYAIYSGWEDPSVDIGSRVIKPADAFDLVYVVRCWYCRAEGVTRPSRAEWDRQLWQWDYDRSGKDD
jgi:hypothetical protein